MSSDGRSAPKAVVFTDLDGTLLDHSTYQPGPAVAALRDLTKHDVLVVFCSAKTSAEQAHLQSALGVDAPFIVENGAGIAGREGIVASFGLPYEVVVEKLREAAEGAEVGIRGYGDMTLEEISTLTGLSEDEASRARAREFSVTFLILGGGDDGRLRLEEEMAGRGLRMVRGARFLTAQGEHDKGTAVRHLIESLTGAGPKPKTFGIGDYLNDVEMLASVDVPMLVRRPDGGWSDLPLRGIVRLDGVGPEGWVLGARHIIERVGGVSTRSVHENGC